MRKSHYVFIGFCMFWIALVMFHPSSQPGIEEIGFGPVLGQAIGMLLWPAILYGIFLLARYFKENGSKNNGETTSKKTSI